MKNDEKNDKEKLFEVLTPIAIGAVAYAAARRSLSEKKEQGDKNPNIAKLGEKVMAIEDISSGGMGDSIKKGNIYTVKSYYKGSYNLKECDVLYNPYLGETSAQWFAADKFQRVVNEKMSQDCGN